MTENDFNFRERLDWTRLDMGLLGRMEGKAHSAEFLVIIEVNLLHPEGREKARRVATKLVAKIVRGKRKTMPKDKGIDLVKSGFSSRYLFAKLTRAQIERLIAEDEIRAERVDEFHASCIYKVWADEEVERFLTRSVQTVKADAAQAAFSAAGRRVVWAVIDSGIQGDHVHFKRHENLDLQPPLRHADFTLDRTEIQAEVDDPARPLSDDELFAHLAIEPENLEDPFGHGTHVAGIIAGATGKTDDRDRRQGDDGAEEDQPHYAAVRVRTEKGLGRFERRKIDDPITGVAPKCKLLSLRVLGGDGKGNVSNVIAAIGYIQKINDYGKWYHVHGANLSVGYEYDAEAYGCGQSPICLAVNRLVKSGVVVVAAAGNTGYGRVATRGMGGKSFKTSLDITINDPGNAEGAITVGATHREKPHSYGVSFFSSRGPTADGRLKPDLVAPGERIISCAAGERKNKVMPDVGSDCDYREDSGTSMAAPHVSGAVAAFLSIRPEFWGQSERVKEIFLESATDLGRERYFQGRGLLDLMRAIQSV